jgi:RNA polymerase sigma factor (sigma-70 family)
MQAHSMQSTPEIVQAVLRGDKAAFAELVRRYERAVWTTAWRVARDYHAAQDITQEAFLEAYRRLSQLQQPRYFGVWLLRIAHRLAVRRVRRTAGAVSVESRPAFATPATPARENQAPTDLDDVLEAVGSLPEHERLVVVLRYFGGHSVAEVAALAGRPVGTVTKQLSRALERLKLILREVET